MVISARYAPRPPFLDLSMPPSPQPQELELSFLAEGNANVIFTLTPKTTSTTTASSIDVNTLLRVKKVVPFYLDSERTQRFHERTIGSLIQAEHLVPQRLVKLGPAMIERLNAELQTRENEGARPVGRLGRFLHPSDYGMFVRNMSSYNEHESVTIEFKPKWLAQSPTAPEAARRCRTCALRAQRKAERKGQLGLKTKADLCPLNMMTGSPTMVQRTIEHLVDNPANYVGCVPSWLTQPKSNQQAIPNHSPVAGASRGRSRGELVSRLTQYFGHGSTGYRLLTTLHNLQKRFDPGGILEMTETTPSDEFLLAMTLRDCSLYVKVYQKDIEARLGDLDPKVAKGGKLQQWQGIERRLLDESWYLGEDETCALSKLPRPPDTRRSETW
ncbi:hypothetical protein K490DRAFT_66887 [Saccharata proteae CBS 121410]|uniref:Inositol-pentakisphosphate 2-kinase n=1 Tax=Saccharata proteae CBS 121410 TaxID=1314787 RepID=A0A9P4HR05_9PEZI|nr:hypothetical protein K490DRAFT_66887 [Saccharata proteae CBS 121410]